MEDVKQEIKGTSVDAAGGTAFARIIIIFLSGSGSGGGCWYNAVGIPLGGGGIVVREQDGRSGEKKRKKKRYKK